MSDYLKSLLASGKVLLQDTKVPKQIKTPTGGKGKLPEPARGTMPNETDPHRIFVKRAIQERLKKIEIKQEIQKFCDAEDEKL
jgi:hypothetical protein